MIELLTHLTQELQTQAEGGEMNMGVACSIGLIINQLPWDCQE